MLSKSEAGKETPEREKMGREPGTLAPGEGEMEGRLGSTPKEVSAKPSGNPGP